MEEEGRRIKIILRNNFKYHGVILKDLGRKIIIRDKFGKEVELNKDDIMVKEVVGKWIII